MRERGAIALVGLSCRVPGAADPTALWSLLCRGSDAVGEMDAGRRALAGPQEARMTLAAGGGTSDGGGGIQGAERGGWLEGIDLFDASFFGISPREAAALDPQQRLMLELCWEACEDAQIVPAKLVGSHTGVFIGAISGDYGDLLRARGAEGVTRHALTGLQRGMIANRVSYALGLRGPSLTVDTGQSSSLVAVHLACESLRRGESELALACGVHLNISPHSALAAERFGALSPDGRCFTFDARANGYVRGEGGGVVVLKGLAEAVADGDRVYCVIPGSAVNNDGGGEGLTAPSKSAQEEVLQLAYRRAAVKRRDVQYVELHGTGTALGDRIEGSALGAVLGAGRPARAPLAVGSVKTNIGHLEGAAGIVGLIKTALAIERRTIPASLNFRSPPPGLALDELRLSVQQELGSWPQEERPLVAGVSSFGVGGTNCHVVLGEGQSGASRGSGSGGDRAREAGEQCLARAGALGDGVLGWVVSGKDDAGLRAQAGRYAQRLGDGDEADVTDVARSLALGRTAFERRAVVLGDDREQLLGGLDALARGEPALNLVEGMARGGDGVVFVFPGQGAQWQGMALELCERSPVFRERMGACAEALGVYCDWSLMDVLAGAEDAPELDQIEVVQPALFAVMVSLAELWQVCGVTPSAVVGHSQGEIAAACVAGGLSLGDAARVVALRSRALGAVAGRGGMLAVAADPESVLARIEPFDGRISLAAVNGPASVVVSGEPQALQELGAACVRDGMRARMIAVDYAAHSAQVEETREALLEGCAPIEPQSAGVAFYSAVSGGPLDTRRLDGDYWYRNLRETVRFERATRALLDDGMRTFVEISPHPVLAGAVQETVEELEGERRNRGGVVGPATAVLSTLRRGEGGPRRFMAALSEAWVAGVGVGWEAVIGGAGGQRVELPTYPFQRERHWLGGAASGRDVIGVGNGVGGGDALADGGGSGFESASSDIDESVGDQSSLARRLVGVPEGERARVVLELVLAHAAFVLGHGSSGAVESGRAFKELGFDSRASVELRNRLVGATGLALPLTLAFEHATPAAVAAHLLDELAGGSAMGAPMLARASSMEPIAIVGIGCRYPGGAGSAAELWQLVVGEVDAIGGFPQDRGWDLQEPLDADQKHGRATRQPAGAFLEDAAEFDAAFFGIGPNEALMMDPQQRLMLEVCWEACEHGGIDPLSLRESSTGVFAGVSPGGYGEGAWAGAGIAGYGLTGSAPSVVSGRIAYALGLQGPALSVDTACSSSLVALHMACSALRAGECELALAGGVTVCATPETFVEFARQRGLAGDGRCKAFAAAADGVGFAEGAGVLVLQPLSEAQREGREVLVVIRGSAVNQDGASNGLTAPNGISQRQVIEQALANAGLSGAEVDAVEGHGTGTTLGDPVEAHALLATYGQDRGERPPLWLGSIKSNIGHTQAAAGVAGVIKMAMALRHGMLPRTLHVDEPSPNVDWSAGSVALLDESIDWPAVGRPRRAGVSSFGISGTNAHLILEQASAAAADVQVVSSDLPVVPWILSGRGEDALRAQAGRLLSYARHTPEASVLDIGLSLTRRAQLGERAVVLGGEREQLLSALDAFAGGESPAAVVTGTVPASAPALAFLFTGQGAQYTGMGKQLYGAFPVFAAALDAACAQLDGPLDCSLRAVMFDEHQGEGERSEGLTAQPGELGLLDQTAFTQAALFALELALFRLVESFGVRADFVMGHSVGEIVAAHVAGVLSLKDACALVAARGHLMGALAPGGAMVAVGASEAEAVETLAGLEDRVSVAAVNGPRSVVLSGEERSVLELELLWRDRGRKTKRLQVSHAFHSPQMDAMLEQFARVAAELSFSAPSIPLVSNVTGEAIATEQLCTPEHWVRHARATVRFADQVRWLGGQGVESFLELGPDGALSAMVEECLAERPGVAAVSLLRRERPEAHSFASALAQLWARGASVNWSTLFEGSGARAVELPSYAFQRERYWLGPAHRSGTGVSDAGQSPVNHELLGAAVALADDGLLLTGRLSAQEQPWLCEHQVLGNALLPGTALLELALQAGARLDCALVRELTLLVPLVLPERGGVRLQVRVGEPDERGERSLSIDSQTEAPRGESEEAEQEWVRHAVGTLALATDMTSEDLPAPGNEQQQEWPPAGAEPLAIEGLYERLAATGLDYGPVFQGLTHAWRQEHELFAEVTLADAEREQAGTFALHPALLDSALHATTLFEPGDGWKEEGGVRLPFSWSEVELYGSGASALRVRLTPASDGVLALALADEHGAAVASVGALTLRAVAAGELGVRAGAQRDLLLGVDWVEHDRVAPPSAPAAVALATCATGLCEELQSAGVACELFADMDALAGATEGEHGGPRTLLLDARALPVGCEHAGSMPMEVKAALHDVLASLQSWLADERLGEWRLAVLTERAVAVEAQEDVLDLAAGAVWGLVRSAQSEHPGRLVLVDLDGSEASWSALGEALSVEEPQVALRGGVLRAPRLESRRAEELLQAPPDAPAWRLDVASTGTLEGLALVSSPRACAPLGRGEVRVEVCAAGLNFRDVLIALGMYPGDAQIGGEGAGVVVELGEDVRGLAVGDRVTGLMDEAIANLAVADSRLLVLIPSGWSYAQAASVPIAFATAYYALVDLAGLKRGERVLIHSAAGGVGIAAVQLARQLGAEVFATASPSKWSAVRALGVPDTHICSSRTLDFSAELLAASGGLGMNVVLNSLAGEFVESSLALLAGAGGARFLEMGKTDVRDPAQIAAEYEGVDYRAFDLTEAGAERLAEILKELAALFADGTLAPAPITGWSVHRAPDAFRHMSQGRHIGKNVLSLPRRIGAEGTVLITGATGALGALLARHLVREHGVRHLLLASRRGSRAKGAKELVAELSALGAHVRVAQCDVAEREQVERMLTRVPCEHPLEAVFHAAGMIDDATLGALTPAQVDRVLAPKLDGAWNLHELTRELDLSAFVLYSSLAGTLGTPGQANYAAANAFLDALAQRRHALGLTATSIAWGLWEQEGELTGGLTALDSGRLARMGILPLPAEQGLRLLDEALGSGEPLAVSARLDMSALRARAGSGELDAMLRAIVDVRSQRPARAARGAFARELAETDGQRRATVVLELVRAQAARALGHESAEAIDPARPFKELGFDSLAGVELRNRLASETGIRLPVSLTFDYPTPAALCEHLLERLTGLQTDAPPIPARSSGDSSEPIAIVGMSCRYPGAVASPEALWEMLIAERDVISSPPSDRGWDLDSLRFADLDSDASDWAREGGFLADAAGFDADFFSIGPREALAMDPQQRLLLEICWEAIERAGIDPHTLRGSDAGVFAGITASGYGAGADPAGVDIDGYRLTGNLTSAASGRVAYTLGLEGPALSIDTACSASLVALHVACQALRGGECSLALAGGAMVMATPELFVDFARQGGLARDGRCKAYSAQADGTTWSEGGGMLLLERLSDARRLGHPIAALVRGSAVNQDGASNGLSAPNGPSQQRVIMQALANAGLTPQQVDAVEGHGTGTALGDPIEAQALLATYGQQRPAEKPLWLGSIKSNIGHAATAAGVAGVIKMAMALQRGVLPRTLHVGQPSGEIDWSSGAIELLGEAIPWRVSGQPRRAGVSSFGISGTNAHVILEEAPARETVAAKEAKSSPQVTVLRGVVPWVLSGRGVGGLGGQAARLRAHVAANPELGVGDIGFSLAGRPVFERRAVVLGEDRGELLGGLGAVEVGGMAVGVVEGVTPEGGSGALAFLFTGQGAQRVGMGRGLYERFPVFRGVFDEVCERLDVLVGCSLRDVVFGSGEGLDLGLLDETLFTQTGLFALEVALFRLIESLGVRPDYLIGHSVGELAAAYVAGVFSLEDACALVVARGRLMGELPAGGAMVAVEASELEAVESLEGVGERVALAAVNGPRSVVFSGDEGEVAELERVWRERGRRVKRLVVSHAFHSPRMDGMLEEFAVVARGLSFSEPVIPVVSNVTGEVVSAGELCSAEYWVRHVRETVRFADGVNWLRANGVGAFLEMGPDGVLSTMVQECVEGESEGDLLVMEEGRGRSVAAEPASVGAMVVVAAVLRAERPEDRTLLGAVAELWVYGVDVEWESLFADSGSTPVTLPTYAFQRERYWLDVSGVRAESAVSLGQVSAEHPLLSAAVGLAGGDGWLFTGRVSLQSHPWLADHVVAGSVLLAGTAFLELALRAGSEVECGVVQELVQEAPLVLSEREGVRLQVVVSEPDELGAHPFEIYSGVEGESGERGGSGGAWTRHASGVLAHGTVVEEEVLREWPPAGAVPLELDDLYDALAGVGLEYGPTFRGLNAAWRRGEEVFAEVSLAEGQSEEAEGFMVHPALLDASLHALAALHGGDGESAPRVPFSWSGVRLHAVGASVLRVRFSPVGPDAVSMAVADGMGMPVVSVESLLSRAMPVEQLRSVAGEDPDSLFRLEWAEVGSVSGASGALEGVVVLGRENGVVESALPTVGAWRDLASLRVAIDGGAAVPRVVLLDCAGEWEQTACGVHERVLAALGVLQEWLADERLAGSRLAVVTNGAVSARVGEGVADLAGSAVWGLVRSAQSENPGCFVLFDTDGVGASLAALSTALECGEDQVAVRDGELLTARLVRVGSGDPGLRLSPDASGCCLRDDGSGSLDGLSLVEHDGAERALGRGEVRVGVRAAGLNFRDVLIALGVYPEKASVGSEGAGVVLKVGPGVLGFEPGDHVMGLFDEAFGTVAVADRRLLTRVPDGWSFAQAASVPIVFLTAYYALVDLARLREGERLLVHAAAGGVGMAAVQLARHLGVEVFATASQGKWDALRCMGLQDSHIASSRTLEFAERFGGLPDGGGIDVVLDCLAGEFVDSSLGLLGAGGRFVEMGKTDIRDPAEVAEAHPGVSYRAFDLLDAGPSRIQEMFGELTALFERGVLNLSPVNGWDIRRAREAFRFMSQSRHIGKNVLTLPARIDPNRTVLVTGGTGGLGATLAEHVVSAHGVRRLLLVSRSGPLSEGADRLRERLCGLGATVDIQACDVADMAQVRAMLEGIDRDHPLGAVVHAAGVIDDGVLGSLTAERVRDVLAPKVDGALNLHELTFGLDLQAFVLFSSIAGSLGSLGQASYAAANSFLDALATQRRAQGLPGVSLAWGPWAQVGGMVDRLGDADSARIGSMGMVGLSSEKGLELFDSSQRLGDAVIAPVKLDEQALKRQASDGTLPALLRGLIRTPIRRVNDAAIRGGSLAERLAGVPQEERERIVLGLVQTHTAAVLNHASPAAIEPTRIFKDLGFDSLAGVELRNRLARDAGLRLSSSIVFDHPTPLALASFLLEGILGSSQSKRLPAKTMREQTNEPVAIVGMACRYPGGVGSPEELWNLVAGGVDAISEFPPDRGWDLAGLYDPDPDHHGTTYTREGGFINEAAAFDAEFFGISPREALAMDPQQRLFLEACWEALEDCGLDPLSLRASQTGVFAGVVASGYGADRQSRASHEGYSLTGRIPSVASGRVAYTLGLEGPAVSVDTACSSSLVALHLAYQSLRGGECSLALAGGVTVMATPELFVEFSRQRVLARDGRCKAFADAADGTAWSEGVGVLVLERLDDAQRHGHEVLAVLRGSAINQDGASNGLTAPNGPSQQSVIGQALASAGLAPSQIDAVEAHGTGTSLGDPIEAQALIATYGAERREGKPLWLGSIKSNIGHAAAASGVAGVIKMVMAMRHNVLPATLHAEEPSREVDWSSGTVALLTEQQRWERNGEPRRAGVSSFGISGTNAHMILEEAPPTAEDNHGSGPSVQMWGVS